MLPCNNFRAFQNSSIVHSKKFLQEKLGYFVLGHWCRSKLMQKISLPSSNGCTNSPGPSSPSIRGQPAITANFSYSSKSNDTTIPFLPLFGSTFPVLLLSWSFENDIESCFAASQPKRTKLEFHVSWAKFLLLLLFCENDFSRKKSAGSSKWWMESRGSATRLR